MIIGRSQLSLAATTQRQVTENTTTSTRISRGGRRTDRHDAAVAAGSAMAATIADTVSVLGAAATPSNGATGATQPGSQSGSAGQPDPTTGKFAVLIALIEHLTGHKIQIADASQLGGNQPRAAGPDPGQAAVAAQGQQGMSISVTSSTTRTESQTTTLAASGSVTTTDGRQIAFDIGLTMSRSSVEVSGFQLTAGSPAMTDPLVLNFGTGPVALSSQKIDFDLDADGDKERISFVAKGNGFLALDRNGNGAVDDGSELFGPTSGDGFAELARFDEDGNGWIDQGDRVFDSLRVWDSTSGQLSSLAQHGVGAISVSEVATPFTLERDGQSAGVLRSSGVWLGENGGGGTIHHIDLAA